MAFAVERFAKKLSRLGDVSEPEMPNSEKSRRTLFKSAAAVRFGGAASSLVTRDAAAQAWDCSNVKVRPTYGARVRTCASSSCGIIATIPCGNYLGTGPIVQGGAATGCYYGTQWMRVIIPGSGARGYVHLSLLTCQYAGGCDC